MGQSTWGVKTTSLQKIILQPLELENAFIYPFIINSTLSCKWSSTVWRSTTQSCCCSPQRPGTVKCFTQYATIWDTEYTETETEVCTTEYEKVCRTETQRLCQPTTRQECSAVYEKQCQTVYRNECVEQFTTEYEPYTETECSTEYKEDCEYQWEGHGNDKVWAPIAGTCKSNPYETCSDVTKSKAVQVPYPVCRDIPEQKCVDVPRQECEQIPDQVCTNQPLQKCQEELAGRFLRRSAKTLKAILMELLLVTDQSSLMQERMKSQSSLKKE